MKNPPDELSKVAEHIREEAAAATAPGNYFTVRLKAQLWEQVADALQATRPEAAAFDLKELHKALEPFALAALESRDRWREEDGAMAELGVPDDADAWMPDGMTQGQLNALETIYEKIDKVLSAALYILGKRNAKGVE